MTLTAMRPEAGLSNGRDVSLWSEAHASSSNRNLVVLLAARGSVPDSGTEVPRRLKPAPPSFHDPPGLRAAFVHV